MLNQRGLNDFWKEKICKNLADKYIYQNQYDLTFYTGHVKLKTGFSLIFQL